MIHGGETIKKFSKRNHWKKPREKVMGEPSWQRSHGRESRQGKSSGQLYGAQLLEEEPCQNDGAEIMEAYL